ncbi:hypothetical protein ABBQ38_008852 [Trebouxia sp. C0009 RCD-2024]
MLSGADTGRLAHAALPHLKLLHAVDCFPGNGGLYEGRGAANAVQRYQTQWLPLLASALKEGLDTSKLIPPLDIAFAWHVHRLNPVAYAADCQHAVGSVIQVDGVQAFKFSDGTDSQSRFARSYWRKKRVAGNFFPTQRDLTSPTAGGSTKGIVGFANIDLLSAMKCQAAFLKQILQPALLGQKQEIIARYDQFLQLRKMCPEMFCVPPLDVDFMWHTHMSMTVQYHEMSMQHFGGLLSHESVSPEDADKSVKRDDGFGSTVKAWNEAFYGSPYNAPWWETMPAVHPFTVFMQQLQVNLPGLYSDSSGMRAGSHAVHALALLLELRKKLEGSSGCYYSCCIRPDRNAVRGLPATLMSDMGKKYGRLPLSSTSNYLAILELVSLAGPSPDAITAVTDVTSRAAVTKTRVRGRPERVPPQFTPYSTGHNNLFIVGAIGSGSCGNIGGCGGGGGGAVVAAVVVEGEVAAVEAVGVGVDKLKLTK